MRFTNTVGIIVALLSGGIAGGCVSVFFNCLFHRRQLRAKFYPKLNNMFSAYLIRMRKPEGRYLITTVRNNPSTEDEHQEFIRHRLSFISDLVQFNELREVHTLRKRLLVNEMLGEHTVGDQTMFDLAPESEALHDCIETLHKKLKL